MQNAQNSNKAKQTRAARIAAVCNAYRARARNAKLAQHAAAQQQAQHAAGMLAMQQLAAQYGLPAPVFGAAPNARANSATAQPSVAMVNINGTMHKPTKAVHVLAAMHITRKATLAACAAHGINPATASTQFGVYQKALQSAAAQQH